MDQQSDHLSQTIEAVSRPLAQWAVNRHAEIDPTLSRRYGPSWRDEWVADVQCRIASLAQAISVRRPVFFSESVVWSGLAFSAREVSTADLATSLRCLREVVEEELPPAAATAVGPCVEAAMAALEDGRPEPEPYLRLEAPHGELALRYFEALMSGRDEDAAGLVLEAAQAGTEVEDLYVHVLAPVQAEVGRLWHLGDVSIGDEHLATAVTMQLMARLRPHFPDVPRHGRSVLAAGVGGNLHEIGIRMVADFFTMRGWRTIFIGANVPRRDLLEAALHHRADLLAVSVGTVQHLRELAALLREVRASPEASGLRVLVGGPPLKLAPDLAEDLGADASASSARDAVDVAERLVPLS